jgi:hypothetical protein
VKAGWLATLLALAAGAAGCGWHRGLSVAEGVDSVGVEIFRTDRDVLERGLEAELHAELSRAVTDLVGARLVAPEDADWVVRGTIAGYRRRGGIRSRQNQLLETGVQLDLRAELVARSAPGASGGTRASTAASVWSGYALDVPLNESDARQRALRHLAETIVLELFAEAELRAEAEPAASAAN